MRVYLYNIAKSIYLLSSFLFASIGRFNIQEEIIENISFPEQIIWLSENNILIVQGENILEYDISKKKLVEKATKDINEFVGIDESFNILLCEVEHFTIKSKDEFSTIFKLKNLSQEIVKEFKIFETVKPLFISKKKIIATTAFDFLEEKFFEIDVESGVKKEIEEPKTKIIHGSSNHTILKKAFIKDHKNYALVDIFGNVYIYRSLDITKIIIPIFTAVLRPIPNMKPTKEPIPDFKL